MSGPNSAQAGSSCVPPIPDGVAAAFDACPAAARDALTALRQHVFATALATDGVGELSETLKWGEPSYVPVRARQGTAVRLAWKAKWPHEYGLFVHCRTTLIEAHRRHRFSNLRYDGNRGVLFELAAPLPQAAATALIEAALTYRAARR